MESTVCRITREVERRVSEELIVRLIPKLAASHRKYGHRAYACDCKYCSYKRYATGSMMNTWWRTRDKERIRIRQQLKELE